MIKKNAIINCEDRWNNKPIDDILKFKNTLLDYDSNDIMVKKNLLNCDTIIKLLGYDTTSITNI